MQKKTFSIEDSDIKRTLTIEIADDFLSRFCGLMGRKRLLEGEGLLLAPCSSVHMCFMRFSIDVLYLDRDYRIQKIVPHLRPWIGLSMCMGAWGVVELADGEAERLGLRQGQRLMDISAELAGA